MIPQWSAPRSTGHECSWSIDYTFGRLLMGYVQWFGISSDPADAELFYPHALGERFGAHGSLETAKRRVEERCPRIVAGRGSTETGGGGA